MIGKEYEDKDRAAVSGEDALKKIEENRRQHRLFVEYDRRSIPAFGLIFVRNYVAMVGSRQETGLQLSQCSKTGLQERETHAGYLM